MSYFSKTLLKNKGILQSVIGQYKSRRNCKQGIVDRASAGDGDDGGGGWKRRVVTGLQPTGELHLGNYFGVVRRCVQLQDRGEDLMVFIADLHALTTPQKAELLQEHVLGCTAALLGAGLDPERTVLFVQSAVPRHAELAWLLACLTSRARLNHLLQYRDSPGNGSDDSPAGLLLYPVLQAADVLVYRGTHVPVGADQLQHLQLMAQLVRTFAHRHGQAFPVPRPLLSEEGSDRIRSLRNPLKKMSKSDPDPKSRILLTDSDEQIHLKIRKAVTDCTPEVTFDPTARPGVSNLVTLHCLAQDKTVEEALEEAAGLTTAQYKRVVAAALCEALGPVRERVLALRQRPDLLCASLRHGAARARERADEVYADVSALVGVAPATTHNRRLDTTAAVKRC